MTTKTVKIGDKIKALYNFRCVEGVVTKVNKTTVILETGLRVKTARIYGIN